MRAAEHRRARFDKKEGCGTVARRGSNGRGAGSSGGSYALGNTGYGTAASYGSTEGGGGATGVFPPEQGAYQPGGYQPEGYQPGQVNPGYPQQPGQGRRPPAPPARGLIDYPRRGRSGWRRWVPSWKLVAGVCTAGLVFLTIAFMVAYAQITVPAPDARTLAQTTIISYSNGNEIGRFATQNRESVQLAQVPLQVQEAVLAAEDHTFYTNSGVNPTSIIRAALSNLRGNSLQGGSTITQQYVKNVYNQRDRSFQRKAKEVFLALKINRTVSKPDILKRYLNTIYLGRGAYGIQAAAHAWFGPKKDVSKLTVSQGAFLAGIINAPSFSDPHGDSMQKARAIRRWNYVVDSMVKDGWLNASTRATLKFPKTIAPAKESSMAGQNGYLMEMAVQEASQRLGLTPDQIKSGGYKITTTFNPDLINAGVKAVKETLPRSKPKGLQIGMASVDPRSGAVRAIYGGTDWLKRQRNAATEDTAEAGSTFKAFTLLAALKSGVSLNNMYSSATPMKIKGYPVHNFGGEHYGYINLVKATQESVNTVYVQLNAKIGPPKTQAAAYAAGIPQSANVDQNLVNVLGSANPHVIDMAGAYSTIASQGIRRPPYVVQSVSDVGTSKILYDRLPSMDAGKRVFDTSVTADASYAMQQVVKGGTGSYASHLGRPAAGKTGTSTDSRSAWFVGFTPQLTTAVAMYQIGKDKQGRLTNLPLQGFGQFSTITGGTYPVRIWTDFMSIALNGKPIVDFPQPTYGGQVTTTAPPTTMAPTPTLQFPTQSPTPTLPFSIRPVVPTATRTIPIPTFATPTIPVPTTHRTP
jgi:membrane peptidoglycan carboxypeptidase